MSYPDLGCFAECLTCELYESKQATIEAHNDSMKRLDERFGDYRDYEAAKEFSLEGLPPFDDWVEEWLLELLAPPGSERSYGRHGRCTSFAKTTGGRCRQPAHGDSGKCYYHGGAPAAVSARDRPIMLAKKSSNSSGTIGPI